MIERTRTVAQRPLPDRGAAIERYRARAEVYDGELAMFEPLREEAIDRLQLQEGETVVDVGCGTGLSFESLKERVGAQGRIVGIELCPQMLGKARERVDAHGWKGIRLMGAAAEEAPLQGHADAAIFHFTHDILRQPEAIANVMRHLKPGARVVATGLQWASPWVWPVNLFVWSAALYSVTTMEGLDRPWSILATFLRDLEVRTTWMGSIYMANGVRDGSPGAGWIRCRGPQG